jgi:hypothetical protein
MAWDPDRKCFTIELSLAPGQYEYKFLLDNEKLIIDPGNPETVYDGFDGRNSVLRVLPKTGHGLPGPVDQTALRSER